MRRRSSYSMLVACSLALGLSVPLPQTAAMPSSAGWTTLGHERGTTVQYPRDVFAVETGEGTPKGRLFTTPDGRARLHLFAIRNERNESPAQFLKRVFPRDRSRLTYDRVASNFFAVSQPSKGRILYRRCNFSDDHLIHCVDLQYPLREKRAWDDVVTRISLSLRPR